MDHKDHKHISDTELVQRSLKNSENFGLLINRYQKKLDRYIRRITSVPAEDREDMLQNIFIKAYTNLNGFDQNLSFNSWVYRIAHNEVVDWSRKRKTKEHYGQLDIEDDIFDQTHSYENFLRELELKEERTEVLEILTLLDLKYREILVLRFIEGKSYEEIGDILKKPTSTVGTLVRRAKESFKKIYQETI